MNMRPFNIVAVAVTLGFLSGVGTPALADPTPASDTATIANDAFQTVPGALHINQAAGNGNVQGNVTDITVGDTHLPLRLTQQATISNGSGGSASIRDFAFSNVSGLVQVNQSAGSGNEQGNLAIVRFAVPAQQLSDDTLAGAMPVQTTSANGTTPAAIANSVSSDVTTFHGKGIVQLNQTAGTGNASANGFLFQVQQGVTH
ncbi:MAG TPA: hypothetical protein VMW12_01660 [Candidatus Dormibacteraeota bacterium]|nr:hypothetical protein [Candidatus Dormibacteraeota bacterium]